MRDIDGVTRVTANDSAKAEAGGAGGSDDNCQTKPSIPQFHLVAAFDGVVVGASAPPATEPATTGETTTATGDGGVGEVEAQSREARAEVNEADAETEQATDLLPSGGG
jgi:hypothetical protein